MARGNKPHKRRFASKRSLKKQSSGKGSSNKTQTSNRPTYSLRGGLPPGNKRRMRQSASDRRAASCQNSSAAVGRLDKGAPPRVIGVVYGNETANVSVVHRHLLQTSEEVAGISYTTPTPKHGLCVLPPACTLEDTLEVAKVADVLLIVFNTQIPPQFNDNDSVSGLCITDYTRELLQWINAQGSPSIIILLQDELSTAPIKSDCLQLHKRFFDSMLCPEHAVFSHMDEQLTRRLCDIRIRPLHWREMRPYLVADSIHVDERNIIVTGFLRGSATCANQLFHLTGLGTFAGSSIHTREGPFTRKAIQVETTLLDKAIPEEQESLQGILPSETELNEEELEECWQNEHTEFIKEIDSDTDLSSDEENIPKRIRYASYRGLRDLHSTESPWHPHEDLPREYASIFKFANYRGLRRDSLAVVSQYSVKPGTYVSLVLKRNENIELLQKSLMILSGQLPHEQKWSVLHHHIQLTEPLDPNESIIAHMGFRTLQCTPTLSEPSNNRNGQTGFLSSDCSIVIPSLSAQTDCVLLASFYGPLTFHPSPILLFSHQHKLIGFGSVLPPDPDRLLLRRKVLHGRVAETFRRRLVVKNMFDNDADVRWFQPLSLYTKHGGRHGRITQPLGTHGLFKAEFDDVVMQDDEIRMALYKRIFPQWITQN